MPKPGYGFIHGKRKCVFYGIWLNWSVKYESWREVKAIIYSVIQLITLQHHYITDTILPSVGDIMNIWEEIKSSDTQILLKCCLVLFTPFFRCAIDKYAPCTHHHQTLLDIVYFVDFSETTGHVDIIISPDSLISIGGGYSKMFSAFIAS